MSSSLRGQPDLVFEEYTSFRVGVEVTALDLPFVDASVDLENLECHIRVSNSPAKDYNSRSTNKICVEVVPDCYGVVTGEAFIYIRRGSDKIEKKDILGYTWFFVRPNDEFKKIFKLQKNQESAEPVGHISLDLVSLELELNMTKAGFALAEFGSSLRV